MICKPLHFRVTWGHKSSKGVKLMQDVYQTEKSRQISIGFLSGCIGLIAGCLIAGSVTKHYTNKQDILSCPKTELTTDKIVQENGQAITRKVIVPARIVPDTLLDNIQPK